MDVIKGSASVRPIPTTKTTSEENTSASVAADAKVADACAKIPADVYARIAVEGKLTEAQCEAIQAQRADVLAAYAQNVKKEKNEIPVSLHAYAGTAFSDDASEVIVTGVDVNVFLKSMRGPYGRNGLQFGLLNKVEVYNSKTGKEWYDGDDILFKQNNTSLRLAQAALMRFTMFKNSAAEVALEHSIGILLDVRLTGDRDGDVVELGLSSDLKVVVTTDIGLECFLGVGGRVIPGGGFPSVNVIPLGIGYQFI
jgi:hypothetical protein